MPHNLSLTRYGSNSHSKTSCCLPTRAAHFLPSKRAAQSPRRGSTPRKTRLSQSHKQGSCWGHPIRRLRQATSEPWRSWHKKQRGLPSKTLACKKRHADNWTSVIGRAQSYFRERLHTIAFRPQTFCSAKRKRPLRRCASSYVMHWASNRRRTSARRSSNRSGVFHTDTKPRCCCESHPNTSPNGAFFLVPHVYYFFCTRGP